VCYFLRSLWLRLSLHPPPSAGESDPTGKLLPHYFKYEYDLHTRLVHTVGHRHAQAHTYSDTPSGVHAHTQAHTHKHKGTSTALDNISVCVRMELSSGFCGGRRHTLNKMGFRWVGFREVRNSGFDGVDQWSQSQTPIKPPAG